MSNLIIQDRPLILLPKLAVAIGDKEALFVQQLHFLSRGTEFPVELLHGKAYVRATVEELHETMYPFWSVPTIRRTIASCKKLGCVVTTNELKTFAGDRTLWYAVGVVPSDESVIVSDQSDYSQSSGASDQSDYFRDDQFDNVRSDQSDQIISKEESLEKKLESSVKKKIYGEDHWTFPLARKLGARILKDGQMTIADQALLEEGRSEELAQLWCKAIDSLHTGVPKASTEDIEALIDWQVGTREGVWWIRSGNIQSPRKYKRIRYRDEEGGKRVSSKEHWFTYLKARAGIDRKKRQIDPIDAAFDRAQAAG